MIMAASRTIVFISSSNSSLYMLLLIITCSILTLSQTSSAALVKEQPLVLKYHNGSLLKGNITLNVIWYGNFTSVQRSIIIDFIQSLSTSSHVGLPSAQPSVASWWHTTSKYKTYNNNLKTTDSNLVLGKQHILNTYSLGKSLKTTHLIALSSKTPPNSINIILTSPDVTLNRFCINRCATHASTKTKKPATYIWVGNPETQCPGQCAWPFHQPIYGPQTPPLISPNDDVGVDAMIINLATVLAGTVTNPFRNGYFQGPVTAPLEAVTACTGVFGKGAYPGYAGEVLVDKVTGGSYNAYGLNSRRYLLPAMWDPQTYACRTLV